MPPVHLSTYLTRSPSALLSRINELTRNYERNNFTVLYALSSNNHNSDDLGRAVKSLTTWDDTRTIGCLSRGLGNTTINDNYMIHDMLSLSVAIFESNSVIPFRSTIPGREETQVGRWHSFRRKDGVEEKEVVFNSDVSWEAVWKGGLNNTPLPDELQASKLSEIGNVIYFSDLKPEGLLSAFDKLPNVNKMGLLASSTPFITGRPVTLFHDQKIYSSGAVGLAFRQTNPTPPLKLKFLEVRKLGEPLTITQSEGNMINTLNDDNPTQLLLSAIQGAGLQTHVSGSFKEEEQFSIGLLSADGQIDCVYRITAGDPSRGSLSIDSPNAPEVGAEVQFLHRPLSAVPRISSAPDSKNISFLTVTDELQLQSDGAISAESELLLDHTFLAASENGFIFEHAKNPGESVKCSLPGSLASFSFHGAARF